MARKRLTAKQVEGKLKPGYHGDGDGLWLAVGKTGSRSWVFKYVSPTALPGANGRKPVTGMGLGAAPLVTLAEARDKALELRRPVAGCGQDGQQVMGVQVCVAHRSAGGQWPQAGDRHGARRGTAGHAGRSPRQGA